GVPRSSSTTSPDVSIEPCRLIVGERFREVPRHGVLAERADGPTHGLIDRLVPFGRQASHPCVRVSADADRRCLTHSSTVRRVDEYVYKSTSDHHHVVQKGDQAARLAA